MISTEKVKSLIPYIKWQYWYAPVMRGLLFGRYMVVVMADDLSRPEPENYFEIIDFLTGIKVYSPSNNDEHIQLSILSLNEIKKVTIDRSQEREKQAIDLFEMAADMQLAPDGGNDPIDVSVLEFAPKKDFDWATADPGLKELSQNIFSIYRLWIDEKTSGSFTKNVVANLVRDYITKHAVAYGKFLSSFHKVGDKWFPQEGLQYPGYTDEEMHAAFITGTKTKVFSL